ncbi:MAG: hypothetical protein PHY29_09780 [Syntrophales bacterium]|nr:hypothetical protein [Syntrophales bacterium]
MLYFRIMAIFDGFDTLDALRNLTRPVTGRIGVDNGYYQGSDPDSYDRVIKLFPGA